MRFILNKTTVAATTLTSGQHYFFPGLSAGRREGCDLLQQDQVARQPVHANR